MLTPSANSCQNVTLYITQHENGEHVSMLCSQYLYYNQHHYPDCYNQNYPTQEVKSKLTAHFGHDLQVWLPKPSSKSELVYSSSIDIREAIVSAF